MLFIQENVKHPELIDLDVVSIAMIGDPDFEDQLMGTFQADKNLAEDIPDIDGPIISDGVCGDSADFLDVEADEYIQSYNNIDDGDGELIDIAIGLNPF